MARLIASAQLTVDGVMDQIEGWFDPERESERYGLDQLRAADALLLGRKTYEFLSTVWPTMTGDPGGYADLVNSIPKFVVSRTLREPLTWNARLVRGDVAEHVAELKRQHTGNLLSYGFGGLAHYLAGQGVLDEIRFWLHPMVWGDGQRPLPTGLAPVRMRLIGATTFSSGVVLVSYEPLRDQD
jgi:dihydrofolate reductase